MVCFEKGLIITPSHPILLDGRWIKAGKIGEK
jgi:hypothetical protein